MASFLKKENLQVLWDVIAEDDFIRSRPRQELVQINRVFNENIQPFYQHNGKNGQLSLIDLNKNYVALMMRIVHDSYSKQKQPQQQSSYPVTSEEIQNSRRNAFDRQLKEQQDSFQSMMHAPKPMEPNFKDPVDKPIENLDLEIKKLMNARNYDASSFNDSSNLNPQSWLQPVQTSVKAEKLVTTKKMQEQHQTIFNTIKIGSDIIDDERNEIIDLENRKKVNWAEDLESVTPNFFAKLKTKPVEDNIQLVVKSEYDVLRDEIATLHKKLDTILQLLQLPGSQPSPLSSLEPLES